MSQRPSIQTFRRHLALTAALVTASFAVVAAVLLFVPLFAHLDTREFDAETLGGVAAYVLHLHESFWPVVLGTLVASITSGMLLFERMRSPLVRFVQAYQGVIAGQLPEPLELRARDYLHDEAAALNEMLRVLSERSEQMRRELERIEQALCEISCDALEPKSAAAVNEAREATELLRARIGAAG